MNTTFYHLNLINPLINASGVKCMYSSQLDELASSNIGSIVTKTCTPSPRQGNPEPRYYEPKNHLLTINSMGLPNEGVQYYLDYYKKKSASLQLSGKGRFLSLGGLSINENLNMLDIIYQNPENLTYLDAIEVNLSCPNIVGKAQLGYDFQNLESYLRVIFTKIKKLEEMLLVDMTKNVELEKPELKDKDDTKYKVLIGCKLPPYFDMSHFQLVADILNKFPRLDYINCINSIGNGLVIDSDTETVVIKPKNGFGGLGGKLVKPTALANVHQFYRLLGGKVKIIGCGGVSNGDDLFQMILAGATLVAVGSQIMIKGVKCIDTILRELEDIMEKKSYSTLDEFRGKLQYM